MNRKEESGVKVLEDFSNGTLDSLQGCTMTVHSWLMDFPEESMTRVSQQVGCTLRRGKEGQVLFSISPPKGRLPRRYDHDVLSNKIGALARLAQLHGAEIGYEEEQRLDYTYQRQMASNSC